MKLNKVEDANIYEFEVKDSINDEEIHNFHLAFQQFKENGERVNLLAKIDKMPDLDKLKNWSELIRMKMSAFDVVDKYAILTDTDWIENFVPIGNFLSPSVQVKAFDEDEKDEAIAWLKEHKVKEYDPKDYLSGVDIKKIGEFNYEIDVIGNKVDHASMAALNQILDSLHKGEKINLILVLHEFPSLDSFKTLIEGLKVDFKILGRLGKYAVVSDMKWIEAYSEIGDFLTPGIDVKSFQHSEIEEARNWISD